MSMKSEFSRRSLVRAAGAAALAPPALTAAPSTAWPIVEGPNTPKICLDMARATRLVRAA